jgi:CUG-BP- and ETR3-like factor
VLENKLFVGMLPRKAGEEEVRALFEPFGEIKEIYMIRNADETSKCAAFIRFVTRKSATAAIAALNDNVTMEGSSRALIVKFADTKVQRQQRQMQHVRRHEMMAMPPGGYSPYAQQMAAPMAMHPSAAPQNVYAMAAHHYGASYPPHNIGQDHNQGQPHAYMYQHPQYAHVPHYGYPMHAQQQQPPSQEGRMATGRPSEGPAGANLFVYHLPHDLTDADLATAFDPFGNVISAKVYVDKYTGESKGFGTCRVVAVVGCAPNASQVQLISSRFTSLLCCSLPLAWNRYRLCFVRFSPRCQRGH